jgi:hypothetical protein
MSNHEVVLRTLSGLRESLERSPDQWENLTLEQYLEAAEAWLKDWQAKHDEPLTWELVAKLFEAAKIYE